MKEKINFDDWSKIELYEYLIDLMEIDDDLTVDEWDRIDLLEIARDVNL